MARLSLSVLGPFQAALYGQPITNFESDKVRALLAYLALLAGRPHRRETLAGLFWPERPESSARRNLNQALYNLRRALGDRNAPLPFLLVTRQTIQFDSASDHTLDAATFAALLAECKAHRHRRLAACNPCLENLDRAAGLYRGGFLDGFSLAGSPAFEEWLLFQRERFHRLAMEVMSDLTGAYDRRGEYETAIRHVQRQVELDPWREEAHRLLMRLLALFGKQNAALAQYETCRRILMQELGIELGEETTILYERIRAGDDLGSTDGRPPHNLPVPLTPFVGREAELIEIAERLRDPACRLLTLFGPGGVGKTRLALEAARDLREYFTHGIYFVPLAVLQSVEAIVPAIGEALGFSFYEEKTRKANGSKQQLLDYLRSKQMLLVLDNLEHLLGGAGVITEILRTASEIKVLVTSRARLNIKGEHLFTVGGLTYPSSDDGCGKEALHYEAVRLFLDSARRVQPHLNPTESDLAEIARICRQAQGIPLALLLASAWIEVLSPAEIAAEIEQDIDFLATDWQDVLQRQRSMRAVFDRSWRLLTGREREICQGLSVFRGGLTREAAGAVTGASLRDLKRLVERTRLHSTPEGRYEVHELLRQYAAEKLGGTPASDTAVRDRHSAHFAAALEGWAADLKTDRQTATLSEMEIEIGNARAAWDWAVEWGQLSLMEQALEGLCLFYDMPVRFEEGEDACRRAAEQLEGQTSEAELKLQAPILAWQSHFQRLQGRAGEAGELLEKSLTLLARSELTGIDTRRERAFVLLERARVTAITDRKLAQGLYEGSLSLYQESQDRWWTANLLFELGMLSHNTSAYPKARQWYKESLALYQALGSPRGTADALVWSGFNHVRLGKIEEAQSLVRQGVTIREAIGDRAGIAFGFFRLGVVFFWQGKLAESHEMLDKCAPIYQNLGLRYELAYATIFLGAVSGFLGRYEETRILVKTGLNMCQEMGYRRESAFGLFTLAALALAEERYAKAQWALQQSVTIYRELGQQDEMGWAIVLLGYATRGMGQPHLAIEYLHEAVQKGIEFQTFFLALLTLSGVSLLLVDQGKAERAVELYALASHYPMVSNSRWFEDIAGRHIATAAALLLPEIVEAARERGFARDLQATVAELLDELGQET